MWIPLGNQFQNVTRSTGFIAVGGFTYLLFVSQWTCARVCLYLFARVCLSACQFWTVSVISKDGRAPWRNEWLCQARNVNGEKQTQSKDQKNQRKTAQTKTTKTQQHTHTIHIHIQIRMCMWMCVCVVIFGKKGAEQGKLPGHSVTQRGRETFTPHRHQKKIHPGR